MFALVVALLFLVAIVSRVALQVSVGHGVAGPPPSAILAAPKGEEVQSLVAVASSVESTVQSPAATPAATPSEKSGDGSASEPLAAAAAVASKVDRTSAKDSPSSKAAPQVNEGGPSSKVPPSTKTASAANDAESRVGAAVDEKTKPAGSPSSGEEEEKKRATTAPVAGKPCELPGWDDCEIPGYKYVDHSDVVGADMDCRIDECKGNDGHGPFNLRTA